MNLKKGDKIAIVSPAGAVKRQQIETALAEIESQGYEPVLGRYALGEYQLGYGYSGTEEERIADLNWALNSEDISAVWATRGGYGCQHLLKHLSFEGFTQKPKWYIGYSDNTVIQSLILKHGYPSIHGQTLKTSSFGVIEEGYSQIFDILKGNFPEYSIENHSFNHPKDFKGQLVGGNLALIYALIGTPYSFSFKDKVLFIEDIGESFYSLDRMLMSLELAGVFDEIKALIIGGMTNMGNTDDNPQYEHSFDDLAYEIIAHRIQKYDFPTVYAFPNGHIYDNRPLIIGREVEVSFGDKVKIAF